MSNLPVHFGRNFFVFWVHVWHCLRRTIRRLMAWRSGTTAVLSKCYVVIVPGPRSNGANVLLSASSLWIAPSRLLLIALPSLCYMGLFLGYHLMYPWTVCSFLLYMTLLVLGKVLEIVSKKHCKLLKMLWRFKQTAIGVMLGLQWVNRFGCPLSFYLCIVLVGSYRLCGQVLLLCLVLLGLWLMSWIFHVIGGFIGYFMFLSWNWLQVKSQGKQAFR